MIDPLDLATSYRTKSDQCRAHPRTAGDSMTKMEWLQLAERWQVLADDVSFCTVLGHETSRVEQAPGDTSGNDSDGDET